MSARAARSIADLDAGVILASVEIAAPPERVFQALTQSDQVMRWWGSEDSYRTTSWVADVRVGGHWRAEGRGRDGSAFHIEGEYLEVDPPRKLVQTWLAVWDQKIRTTLTYLLEPVAGGTRLLLRHEGFKGRPDSCRNHASGWERVLGWLSNFLPPPASADRFYLLRLIPPRPSFAMDMTAAERAVMQRHVGYWTGQLAGGAAVLFGPVADPKGPWGLCVVRVPDEAALARLQADDPALTIAGSRYEAIAMPRAVCKDA